MSSFNRLKGHILYSICPRIRTTFGVHDPLGVQYIFQFRMNLRPLRNRKKHHHFADTPSEICECNQGVEDTRNFLFECPRYATQKANLEVKVIANYLGNQPELFLYGHQSHYIYTGTNLIVSIRAPISLYLYGHQSHYIYTGTYLIISIRAPISLYLHGHQSHYILLIIGKSCCQQ